jgi:Holliday junction resolvase RusA-like endonuclease
MILLSVKIPGAPVGKGRPRITTVGGFARAYTPAKTRSWEKDAAAVFAAAWGNQEPLAVPVAVSIDAVSKRPGSLSRRKDPDGRMWRPAKVDADNVAKAVNDALENAGVVLDDYYIVDLHVRSLYTAKGEEPRVEVTLRRIDGYPT